MLPSSLEGAREDKSHQQDAKVESPYTQKLTVYISRVQMLKLEEIRLERIRRGERADKSTLIREAIERMAS